MVLFYFLLFIFGLIFGSFITMLSWRLPRRIPLTGRSRCDRCLKTIPWFCNIPFFSYLFLGGKCVRCKTAISIRYPIIELCTAGIYVLTGYLWFSGDAYLLLLLKQNLPTFISLGVLLLFCTIAFALLVIDLEFQILPDELIFCLGGVVFFVLFVLPSPLLFSHLFWGLFAFALFLGLFSLTSGRGMGFGDVNLSFILGSFLGYPGFLLWLLLSFVLGAVVGIFMLLFGKATMKQEIAFGPYLLIASFVTFFFGDHIIQWYISFL